MSKHTSGALDRLFTRLRDPESARMRRLREVLANNVWYYDPVSFTLNYEIPDSAAVYQVLMETIYNSDKVLDWLAQVNSKTWATPQVVGDLVIILDEVVNLRLVMDGHYSFSQS